MYINIVFFVFFQCNIDLWTVAQAYVFFEKVILKVTVTFLYLANIQLIFVIVNSKYCSDLNEFN